MGEVEAEVEKYGSEVKQLKDRNTQVWQLSNPSLLKKISLFEESLSMLLRSAGVTKKTKRCTALEAEAAGFDFEVYWSINKRGVSEHEI